MNEIFKLKYLVLDRLHGCYNVPIIFPDCIEHNTMANDLGGKDNVLGAGFFDVMDDGTAYCYGESMSLNKTSRPEDQKLLQRFM